MSWFGNWEGEITKTNRGDVKLNWALWKIEDEIHFYWNAQNIQMKEMK